MIEILDKANAFNRIEEQIDAFMINPDITPDNLAVSIYGELDANKQLVGTVPQLIMQKLGNGIATLVIEKVAAMFEEAARQQFKRVAIQRSTQFKAGAITDA